MKTREFICARTHAEFLNQAFGTNYNAWMKSRWDLSSDTWVWMVCFDKKVRGGWKNTVVSNAEIWEEYVGIGDPTYKNREERKFRIVVEISKTPNGLRQYHILGKFMFDFENSTFDKHILIKAD